MVSFPPLWLANVLFTITLLVFVHGLTRCGYVVPIKDFPGLVGIVPC
jgi:hypothetical protein